MAERIALVTTEGAYCGAEEAGLSAVTLPGPSLLVPTLRALVAGGEFGLIAVSEEAAAGSGEELEAIMAQAPPGVSVVLVPAPGARRVEGLIRLRRRFAGALGVDVWASSAARVGADV